MAEAAPSEAVPSLGDEINSACHEYHVQLNELILKRLPLALPPFIKDTGHYATGLAHIGLLYINFETEWKELLVQREDDTISSHVKAALETAWSPALERTPAIREDFRLLTKTSEDEVIERLAIVGRTGTMSTLLDDMRNRILAKSHILLAYAWALYLALLSGGVYIRSRLAAETIEDMALPLSFFDIGDDAANARKDESLKEAMDRAKVYKQDFKARFAEAEMYMTAQERQDIIEEAARVFAVFTAVIEQLDVICGTAKGAALP